MADNNAHRGDPSSAPESQSKQPTRPEAIHQDDTVHKSDSAPGTGKDTSFRFWSAYAREAQQHDNEFVERENGEMDVILIVAGLFSAVSSAFIVNMQSSLAPSASDTTNALLKILVNKIDNTTFPPQEAALPVWTGPSSTTIWIQTLAYASLSSSLLAAFGAVLGKQWLGHFRTSRFGRGALDERCKRRQQKLDGLESWHFTTILASIPIFLHLSLLFFAISLAANIWTLQPTVASIIMATTAFGLIFYFFTVVSSLKSPNCPFQTPVSTMILLCYTVPFRRVVRNTWKKCLKTWGSFLDSLLEYLKHALATAKDLITGFLTAFVTYLWPLLSAPGHTARSTVDDPEAAGDVELVEYSIPEAAGDVELAEYSVSEAAEEHTEILDLDRWYMPNWIPQSHTIQSRAVQWMIATSTDMDNIAAAAEMVPEIEWAAERDIYDMLNRLKGHFYACFDPTQHILPLAQTRAMACLKAMTHCSVEQSLFFSFTFHRDGMLFFRYDGQFFNMAPDQTYLVICCALGDPVELNLKSLRLSDRMWLAHMFTYCLHRGGNNPEFVTLLIDFIDTCLDRQSPTRLAADCVLLAGMLLGLRVDRQHLDRLDKSRAIETLRACVINRMLDVLLGDIPERQDTAQKLLHPLLQQFNTDVLLLLSRPIVDRVTILIFRLLGKDHDTVDEDKVRSRNLASLIHFIFFHKFSLWDTAISFTAAQFDLLVVYHLHICEGTDYGLINATFWMLQYGSLNNPERMRCYIDTIIRFMGEETTCVSALRAALAIRVEITSLAQHDESLRKDFSKGLALAVLLDPTQAMLAYVPNAEISAVVCHRDIYYLQLLCTLTQDPTWHLQLHQNGHFDNCLAIAETLLSQIGAFNHDRATASIAHIFAIIDASGDETHPLFNTVRAYLRRPLVLRVWKYIFNTDFFLRPAEDDWRTLSREGYFDSLPSLVAYARKQFNDTDESLIALVEQVCRKLDEEKQQREQGDAQHVHTRPYRYKEISALGNRIRVLLQDVSFTDV